MIRPFQRGDIPQVTALRRKAFRNTRWESDDDLERAFDTTFFGNPWRDDELTGLVYEDAQHHIIGFVGIVPRPFQLGSREVRGAVSTQFMVDPAHRGLAGIELVRRLFAGPQQFLLSDAGNEAAIQMWTGLGGFSLPWSRLSWHRVLRPATSSAARLGSVGRAVAAAVDVVSGRLIPRRFGIPRCAGTTEPLQLDAVVDQVPRIAGARALRPVYSVEALTWLMERLRVKYGTDAVHAMGVCDAEARGIGWFIYAQRGTEGLVQQVVAAPQMQKQVLAHLFGYAHERGIASLVGRLDFSYAEEVSGLGASFQLRGSGVLAHTRDAELRSAALEARAMLTALEGEWWMTF